MQKASLPINWMGCDGSNLVNSWNSGTHNTAKESLHNLCNAIEHVIKPESSILLSRHQFHELQHEKDHIANQWMTILCIQANQYNFSASAKNTFMNNL